MRRGKASVVGENALVENARGWVFSLNTRNAFSRTFFPRPKTRKPARKIVDPVQKSKNLIGPHCAKVIR